MKKLIPIGVLVVVLSACAGPGASILPSFSAPPTFSPAPTQTPLQTQTPGLTETPGITATPIATAPPSPSATLAQSPSPVASIGGDLTLVTHDSFAATDSVISDFETQFGVTLKVLRGGDAGTMVNQAILTKNDPLGDVLYGVDNTFLSRALDAGIFVPYVSPAAANIPAEFKLDPQNRVTPIDYGDVCVNYDLKAFGGTGSGAIPQTISDLTQSMYKGTLVVENPATSSTGLAFMLATIARFGETGDYTWLDYWRDLKANDVLVVPDWNSAYYNEFSAGGGGGDRPLVVSYATDPAAAMYSAGQESGTPGVQTVVDGCFRQIEFAAVLAGAANPAAAQAWVDYMASVAFQSDMPFNMYVFPVNPDAQVPELFARYAAHVPDPLTMDPATIAANRDIWIQQWTDTVLH